MRASIIAIAAAFTLIISGAVVGQDDVTVVSNDQICNLVSDDLAACEQALITLAAASMLPEAFAPLVGSSETEPSAAADADGAVTGLGTQSRSDMAVTITEVDWDVEANAFLPPADGNRFIAIHVIYEALQSDTFPGTWTAIDEDGFTHSVNFFTGLEPSLQPFQQLRKGDKTRGWVAFEVPGTATSLEFIEWPFLFGDDLVWAVTR